MEKFTTLEGVAAPLKIINVDTDMIIPKQYLKTIKRTGLGRGLFSEQRYKDDGSENPDFILNKPAYRNAKVLVAGDNFGCGSSREHAPWALLDFGIRCVISTSFGDIFYNNCFKNGILPIRVTQDDLDKLFDDAERGANATLTIDLPNQEIRGPDGGTVRFEIDPFRKHCLMNGLRSQVSAGHKTTVYSFEPIAQLPEGVGNAEAEEILPHSFSEKLRTSQPNGSWRDWTILQFSDFFRMRLMARSAGLWLDADVLLLKPIEIDPARPYFAWERPRQLGNSVLYLPSGDPIVAAFADLMEQDELTPDWLALRHRLTFLLRQLRGRSNRVADIRVAIYGPAALTALARRAGELHYALPKKSFYAVHAEPKRFFEPQDLSALTGDPEIIGLHVSPKGRGNQPPIAGSLYAWAAQRFGSSETVIASEAKQSI